MKYCYNCNSYGTKSKKQKHCPICGNLLKKDSKRCVDDWSESLHKQMRERNEGISEVVTYFIFIIMIVILVAIFLFF